MSGFDIRDLRKNHAEKFAQQKEQEEKEKKVQEEKKRIETDEAMIKEIMYKHDFEDFTDQLSNIMINIQTCTNIIELDIYVESFKQQLENNIRFTETEYCHQEIIQKVTELIHCVSQNENSKFNVTVKDINTDAAQRITNNIKTIMNLSKCNENDVHIDLMDTSNDEHLAKKLQDDDNLDDADDIDDMEFHKFIPIHQRIDQEMPDLINNTKNYDYFPVTSPISFDIPKLDKHEYYAGFDVIDDPDLIQLSYFQNDLMDE